MPAWLSIVLWWFAFGATHMTLSSARLRPQLVQLMGQGLFFLFYSVVAFGTFIPLVSVYLNHRHQGPQLWNLATVPGIHTLSLLLAGFFFACAIAGLLQPSPLGVTPGARPQAYGLTRITRHPAFMALGLWGLSHTLLNSFATDLLFFGGFFVFAVIGCWHQDQRKRALQKDQLSAFFAETSFWPFAAILADRNRLVWSELPVWGFAAGLAAAAAAYWLHGALLSV
ncbi:MAG: NnrU family protein [Nevskiales bacterium]